MMRKIFLSRKVYQWITLSFGILLSLSGCNSGSTAPSPVIADTTVMVYMIGTNLVSGMDVNLREMESVGSTSNMNIIVETGGGKTPEWTTVKRWKIIPGGRQQLGDDLGVINMAESSAITSFIKYAAANYPAKKYILVFSSHGGGPNGGYGGDLQFNNAFISMPNLVSAVADSGLKFELLGFDACLMASVEISSALAPYTNYYIASEDLIPGNGWSWTPFMQYVTSNPNANGQQIGQEIINTYVQKYTPPNKKESDAVTLSLVNTSAAQTAAIVNSVNGFAQALNPYINSAATWKEVARARLKSYDFATNTFFGTTANTDVVDMIHFAAQLNRTEPFKSDANFIAASDNMVATLQNGILYNKTTELRNMATGLMVYFPSILAGYESAYYTTNTQNGPFNQSTYTTMVNSYASFYTQNKNILMNDFISPITRSGTILQASIMNGDYAQVYATADGSTSCALEDYEGDSVTASLCYKTMQPIYNAVESEGAYIVSFNKAGSEASTWPKLTDKDGQTSNIIMVPDGMSDSVSATNIDYYLIPAKLVRLVDNKSLYGYIRVTQNLDGSLATPTEFLSSASSAAQSTNFLDTVSTIATGDKIYLGNYAYYNDGASNVWRFLYNTQRVFIAPLSISENSTASGKSKFAFVMADLTGNTNVSESIAYSN